MGEHISGNPDGTFATAYRELLGPLAGAQP
jgi:hypothetical protein